MGFEKKHSWPSFRALLRPLWIHHWLLDQCSGKHTKSWSNIPRIFGRKSPKVWPSFARFLPEVQLWYLGGGAVPMPLPLPGLLRLIVSIVVKISRDWKRNSLERAGRAGNGSHGIVCLWRSSVGGSGLFPWATRKSAPRPWSWWGRVGRTSLRYSCV